MEKTVLKTFTFKPIQIRINISIKFTQVPPTAIYPIQYIYYKILINISFVGDDGDEEEGGEEGEEQEEKLPSCMDYVMHFVTVFWKVLFALIPPTGQYYFIIFFIN